MSLKRDEKALERLASREAKELEEWEKEVRTDFGIIKKLLEERPFGREQRKQIIERLRSLEEHYRDIKVIPEAVLEAEEVLRRLSPLIRAVENGSADTPSLIADNIIKAFQLNTTLHQVLEKRLSFLNQLTA